MKQHTDEWEDWRERINDILMTSSIAERSTKVDTLAIEIARRTKEVKAATPKQVDETTWHLEQAARNMMYVTTRHSEEQAAASAIIAMADGVLALVHSTREQTEVIRQQQAGPQMVELPNGRCSICIAPDSVSEIWPYTLPDGTEQTYYTIKGQTEDAVSYFNLPYTEVKRRLGIVADESVDVQRLAKDLGVATKEQTEVLQQQANGAQHVTTDSDISTEKEMTDCAGSTVNDAAALAGLLSCYANASIRECWDAATEHGWLHESLTPTDSGNDVCKKLGFDPKNGAYQIYQAYQICCAEHPYKDGERTLRVHPDAFLCEEAGQYWCPHCGVSWDKDDDNA
jgi:hypothetical protein